MEVQLFGSLNSTTDSIILLNFNILDLGECEMKYIDKAHWSRKDHFDYFRTFSYPHFNLCANMDITLFSHFVKQQKLLRSVPLCGKPGGQRDTGVSLPYSRGGYCGARRGDALCHGAYPARYL